MSHIFNCPLRDSSPLRQRFYCFFSPGEEKEISHCLHGGAPRIERIYRYFSPGEEKDIRYCLHGGAVVCYANELRSNFLRMTRFCVIPRERSESASVQPISEIDLFSRRKEVIKSLLSGRGIPIEDIANGFILCKLIF